MFDDSFEFISTMRHALIVMPHTPNVKMIRPIEIGGTSGGRIKAFRTARTVATLVTGSTPPEHEVSEW